MNAHHNVLRELSSKDLLTTYKFINDPKTCVNSGPFQSHNENLGHPVGYY